MFFASEFVSDESKKRLKEEHSALDPVLLKMEIEQKLRKIFVTFKRLAATHKATSAA